MITSKKKNNNKKLDQGMMPLWNAHWKYMNSGVMRMDVPGHKGGTWKNPMVSALYETFKYDINSCKEIDNLANPTGVIDKALYLFAKAFGADEAHFLVNGTTQGIHAMMLASLKPRDTILIPDNVHKSVINGIILMGLRVGFIRPEFSREWGVANNITLSSLQKTYDKYPKAKAILLLNPTYFGVVADLKSIAKWARQKDLYLFCDEAHGSHFHFSNKMPLSGMEAGADAAAMSVHKTSGSLTQSSALVWNKKGISNERILRAVNILQSTSPNYLLMSSLDAARYNLYHNGKEDIDRIISLVDYAKEEIKKIPNVDVMDDSFIKNNKGVFKVDATKLIIKMDKLGLSGFEVYEILRKNYKIQAELGEFKAILFIITPSDDYYSINKLINAIKRIARQKSKTMTEEIRTLHNSFFVEREVVHTIRKAFFMEVEEVDWKDAEDRISGDSYMTYPPGIALLLPGQRITKKHIKYNAWLMNHNAPIVSNASGPGKIIVLKKEQPEVENE